VAFSPGAASNAPNRRRYRRVRASIQCRPAGVEFFAQHLESIDVSFGGLRINSDAEYRVGAPVRLDIFSPTGAPITLTAEVVWIEAVGNRVRARFDVGLAFVELTSDALKFLMTVLDSEVPWVGSPESKGLPAPEESSVEFIRDEPVSEILPVTSEPPTVRQGRGARSMLARIPVVVVDAEMLRAERLDARAGFLVSLIDGITMVESLLNLSGMSPDETLALLEDLRRRGVVELIDSTEEPGRS
jgi:Tfp pilus assembly protein PilZ